MTKTAELLVKLLGSWDAKAVEVVAANFDGERARRQFAAASAWAVANSPRLLVETASGAQINERGSYSVTRTALRALSVSTRTIKKNQKTNQSSIRNAGAALHFAQLFGDEGSDLVGFFAAVGEGLV
jgi:hypothetical protein